MTKKCSNKIWSVTNLLKTTNCYQNIFVFVKNLRKRKNRKLNKQKICIFSTLVDRAKLTRKENNTKTHHSGSSFSWNRIFHFHHRLSRSETTVDEDRDGQHDDGDQPVVVGEPMVGGRPGRVRANWSRSSSRWRRSSGGRRCWGCRRKEGRHLGHLGHDLRRPSVDSSPEPFLSPLRGFFPFSPLPFFGRLGLGGLGSCPLWLIFALKSNFFTNLKAENDFKTYLLNEINPR